MGSFFLFAATALFLAGLGALLAFFAGTLARLKTHRATSIYFQRRRSGRKHLLIIFGVLAIIIAQGCYWFYNEANQFVPFDDSIPQMTINFIYEQEHLPRAQLVATDRDYHHSKRVLPVLDDQFYVSTEVIQWKKFFRLLGLRDCYRFTGLYYGPVDSLRAVEQRDPDYRLGAGPSGLISLIRAVGSVFPAESRVLLSPQLVAGANVEYKLELSANDFYCLRSVDNLQAADYSQ